MGDRRLSALLGTASVRATARTRRALSVWALSLALGSPSLAGGCREDEPQDDSAPAPPQLEPKREVVAPPGFEGPIDPEWPPSHGVDFAVELQASSLLRERLAMGKSHDPSAPLLSGDVPNLFVEQGRIGDFDYLEVIIGPLRNPDNPMPLMVLLHGRGGKPHIPDGPFDTRFPIRVFLPRAPDRLGNGYTWLATYTRAGDEQLLARSIAGTADKLAPAIEAFRRLRPTKGRPILVGFSQGGIMALALATRFPGKFAAAFPMAGWLPEALWPTPVKGKKFPYIFAQHGTTDTVVPTKLGEQTVRALRSRGLRVDYRADPGTGHVVSPTMESEVRRAVRRVFQPYAPRASLASKR